MSEEQKCPICGEPTYLVYGKYPRKDGLCSKHATQAHKGNLIQCETCKEWHKKNEPCNCNPYSKKNTQSVEHDCFICGNKTKNKYLCNDCYKRTDNQAEGINKNTTYLALRDYYYNLKNYIYRTENTNEEVFFNQLAKLYTLADLSKRLFNREDLINKIANDIKDIKESKAKAPQKEISEVEKIEKDIKTAGVNRAKDGHFVKSEYEVTVDDILFDLSEVHVYEKVVAKITERTVVCDWYIPVYKNNGIYIELWGIDKNYKYNINKEEKRTLYKKHNLPLIEIEKDELKGDTLGLYGRIEQEIIKYKDEIVNKK